MKNKRILIATVAVLIVFLGVWRFWPHSLNAILDINEESFNTISVTVSEFGIENNAPNIDVYRLDVSSPDDDNYAPIMAIIQNTAFRSDFRNLLPWDILSVGSGSKNITHSANIMLTWGDNNDAAFISFHGNRIVSFDINGKTEFLVYHPTNRAALNEIAVYIKENGIPQS